MRACSLPNCNWTTPTSTEPHTHMHTHTRTHTHTHAYTHTHTTLISIEQSQACATQFLSLHSNFMCLYVKSIQMCIYIYMYIYIYTHIHLCLSLSTTPHLQLHLLPRQLKCSDAHSLRMWVARADPKKNMCSTIERERSNVHH